MNRDLPDGSAEQVKEIPAGLKSTFEKVRHTILGEEGLKVTPEDIEQFEGLLTEDASVEEIETVHQGFSNQFAQAASEFIAPKKNESRLQSLKEFTIKSLHNI